MTRMRMVPSMLRSASSVAALGVSSHVGDHIAKFAFGCQRLEGNVDVLLAEHMIDMSQHTRKIVVQMGDTAHTLALTEVDLREVHGQRR